MALHPLRLRRALSLSFSLLHRSLQAPKPISFALLSTPRPTPTPTHTLFPVQLTTRFFTSTTTLSRKAFDPETDEIGPDTILFEGCDYNHWLVTMDFPKDSNLTRDQMIDTYVNTAAQVFGSVEEAKKKLYALSTTTYQGFQVECSEETSEKFKSLPGVVFVLPDSYIDPVNKEYGGDKYVNGEIFPRPAPVHYGRRSNWDRRPREQNYGPPPQQNYGPRPQQNYGPPLQQNSIPPLQQNSVPPPSPPHNYEQPPQQNYSPPPQQGYASRPPSSYGQPPPQSFGQKTQPSYGNSPNYPPQQNYSPAASGKENPMSSYQGTFNQPEPRNYGAPPPQNYELPPWQSYIPPLQEYEPYPDLSFGQPSSQSLGQNTQQSYGNSPNFPPLQNYSPAGLGNGYPMSSYQGNLNQPEPRNHYAQGQRNRHSHVPPEQRGFLQDADSRPSEGGTFERVSGGQGSFSSVRNN
ncbi:hypothetical protein ACS0TY_002323 [Phlomoides rotata]